MSVRFDIASKKKMPAAAIVLLVAIVLLSVVQGGFSALTTSAAGCVVSAALAVFAIFHRRQKSLNLVSLLFLLLAALYLISSFAHGVTLTSFSSSASVCAIAAAAMLASYIDREGASTFLDALCIWGFCLASFGILAAADVVFVPEGVFNGRLQGSFQYANAAGCFYGVVALLAVFSERRLIRALVPLPVLALLLTQSGGASLAFALAAIGSAVYLCCNKERGRVSVGLCQCVLSFAVFLVSRLLGGVGLLALAAVLLLTCIALWRFSRVVEPLANNSVLLAVSAALAVLLLVVACFLLSDRLQLASSTLMSRLAQMDAAITLLVQNPLLGVGPGNWPYAYPMVQRGVFHASLVHCSYLQVAVDAGVVGLLALIAIVVLAAIGLVRAKNPRTLVAFAMVALHMLVDFDMTFGSLAFIFAALSVTDSFELSRGKTVISIAVGILGFGICALGFTASLAKQQIENVSKAGDSARAVALYSGQPMAHGDTEVETACLKVLLDSGNFSEIVDFEAERGVVGDEQALVFAQAYDSLGQNTKACQILISELEREPYNNRLYSAAREYFKTHGIDSALTSRYKAAVSASKAARKQSMFRRFG